MTKSSKDELAKYFEGSKICMENVISGILNKKVREYEQIDNNKIKSLRLLYEGGLISKRKYTSIRNCDTAVDFSEVQQVRKCPKKIMKGCHFSKILSYKPLM